MADDDNIVKADFQVDFTEKGKDSVVQGLNQIDATGQQAATDVSAAFAEMAGAAEQVTTATQATIDGIRAEGGAATEAAGSVTAMADQSIAASAEEADSATAVVDAITAVGGAADAGAVSVAALGAAAVSAGGEAATALEDAATAEQQFEDYGPQVSAAWLDVGAVIGRTEVQLEGFFQKLKEDGRLPKTAITELGGQLRNLQTIIAETEGLTDEEATAAQAAYGRIRAAITELIAKAGEAKIQTRLLTDDLKFQSGQVLNLEQSVAHLAGGYGGAALQLFLYAGMAGIAYEAVKKLSDALDSDAQATEMYKTAFGSYADTIKRAAYDLGGGILDLAADAATMTTAGDQLGRDTSDIAASFLKANLAAIGYKDGVVAVEAAHRAGIGTMALYNLTIDQLNKISEMYRATLARGVLGQQEWQRIVKEGNGTVEGLIAAIERHKGALADDAAAYKPLVAAEKEHQRELDETAKHIHKEIDAIVEEVRQIDLRAQAEGSEQLALQKLFDIRTKLFNITASFDIAEKGTTASINEAIDAIKHGIDVGERYSGEIAAYAAELDKAAKHTDNLISEDRQRIQVIVDLAAKYGTLSTNSAKLQQELLKEIQVLRLMDNSDEAAVKAQREKVIAIQLQIAAITDLALKQKLNIAIEDQQRESTENTSKAAYESTKALDGVAASAKNLGDNTVKSTTDLKSGKITISNVGDASKDTAGKVDDLGAAQAGASTKATTHLTTLANGQKVITNVGDATKTTSGHVDDLAASHDKASQAAALHKSELERLKDGIHEVSGALKDDLMVQLRDVGAELEKIRSGADAAANAMTALAQTKGAHTYASPAGPPSPAYVGAGAGSSGSAPPAGPAPDFSQAAG